MLKKEVGQFFFAVLCASGVFFFTAQDFAFAWMSEMQNPRYDEQTGRAHGIEAPGVVVELKTTPAQVEAGSPAAILFSIGNTEGKPIRRLSIHQDRLLHVIIASQDFSVFAHIHPEDLGALTSEMLGTATFPRRYTFPKAGV